MNFDDLLTQDAHEVGAKINIINPVTREPTDVFIHVMGIDSKAFREARNAALRRAAKGEDIDSESLEIDSLVAVTTGWEGLTDKDGKSLEFTQRKCRQLYEKSPGLRDQVDRFISDRKNFTNG